MGLPTSGVIGGSFSTSSSTNTSSNTSSSSNAGLEGRPVRSAAGLEGRRGLVLFS